MRSYRIDDDGSGNSEVSVSRPRKLRPLDDEEAAPPKPALKSALKGATAPEPVLAPKPPEGSPPKSALKSAMKNRAPIPEPEEEPAQPAPPPKSALKSAMKRPPPVEMARNAEPPPQPPTKAKSALKSRKPPPEEPADLPLDQLTPKSLSRPNSTRMERCSVVSTNSNARKTCGRPSLFRMNVDILEDDAWSVKGLCRHYFSYALQRMMWDQSTGVHARKSIKLNDLEPNGKRMIASQKSVPFKLKKTQSFVIEAEMEAAAIEVHQGVISPLKDLFLQKKPNADKVRTLLQSLPEADRTKWVNVPLDDTPPPMPSPLFFAVAGVHANLVEVLIEFDVDVLAKYPGKSMLKGWIKPQTELVECVRGRKGRFVGTMLGDKLETIEGMLMAQAKKQTRKGDESPKKDSNRSSQVEPRQRRKSVQMRSSQGMIEHTHDHPSAKYELVGTHDDGNPSNVREAMDVGSGEVYAVKAGSKFDEASAKDPEAELWNEIGLIRRLDHPNIVRLHETFENDSHIFMVFEGCLGGELFDKLVTEGSFTEGTAMRIGYQIGSALRHLHQIQICHRDIQPECFFLAEEGPLEETGVKLMDFSTAREFATDGRMYTKVCSLHYVAPEILSATDGYTERIDVWSFGVLLYIMLSGTPPFNAESELEILNMVKGGAYEFNPESIWSSVSANTKDLISKCIEVDASKRLDSWALMDHPAMVNAEENGAVYMASESLGRETNSTRNSSMPSNAVKAAFSMMAEVISDEQMEELRKMFTSLDSDETGMVELKDCVAGVRNMVQHSEEAAQLLKVLDSDGITGRVNYTMYLATMTDRRRHLRREAARAVFNNFDIDKNGNISLYEIAQALAHSEEIALTKVSNVSMKEVQKIWREMRTIFVTASADQILDKEMGFDEFFKKLPNSNKDIGF